MKKNVLIFSAIILLVIQPILVKAEQADTYQKIKEWTPFFGGGKKVFFDSDFEYSFVNIGAHKFNWKLLTDRLMYLVRGQIPYVEFNWHERDRVSDLTIAPGCYFQFKDSSLHVETGYGLDTDYIYEFQTTVDYEHRLYKTLFGKVSTRYLHYKHAGDVFIVSPGFTYYFGDHFLTGNYGFSLTEARRAAHWGSLRLNLALLKQVTGYAGGAIGERLFDIYPIAAPKQGGFIIFTGLDFRILENVKAKTGFSYSEERPNFIKRSVEGGLSIRF